MAPSSSLEGWPDLPRQLKAGSSKILQNCINILLILVASFFFVFAGFVKAYNGVPASQVESALSEAAHYGPTIFPILFTATVGGAIKSIFLWKLQEGARIGTLDILLGSTTITNTIATQIKSRPQIFLGIFLVLLWSLSPTGGQASLRVLSFQPAHVLHTTALQYMNSNSSYSAYMAADTGSEISPVDAIFLSVLAAPLTVKNSSGDNWGNLKIPMLEAIPGYSDIQTYEWFDIGSNQTADPTIYTALLGLPIASIPNSGNGTFNLETSYWTLNCPTLEGVTSYSELISLTNDSVANNTWAPWGSINSTMSIVTPSGSLRCEGNDPEMPPRIIEYVSWDASKNTSETVGTKAVCTIQTSYVELNVFCNTGDCTITKLRRSTLTHPPPAYTWLDTSNDCTPDTNRLAFDWFAVYFVRTIVGVHAAQPTALQVFFTDPGDPFNLNSILNIPPVYQVGNTSFSRSFAQLLNTYWLASVGTEALVLGHPADFSSLSAYSTVSFSLTTATVSETVEVLICDSRWWVILLISTAVMMLAAVMKFMVDLKIWVPDLAMNVSTLTRGNPAFAIPVGGSGLSDSERLKFLKDVKARFGDVDPGGQAGYLVVGGCLEDGGRAGRYRRQRSYI